MVEVSLGLKVYPKLPSDIDIEKIKETTLDLILSAGLKKPRVIALSGSRVWGLADDSSDIDVYVFGEYEEALDLYENLGNLDLEVSIIPEKLILSRKLPFETRWDIITAIPLSPEYEIPLEMLKETSRLTHMEVNCILSHIINRISWLGVSSRPIRFKNIRIYSFPERYRKLPPANTFNVLFYSLDLLAIAQYVLNEIPYPFAKWRLIHLDKLATVSKTLLDFSKADHIESISIEDLFKIVSASFEETLKIIEKIDYLRDGFKDESTCIREIEYYPYF